MNIDHILPKGNRSRDVEVFQWKRFASLKMTIAGDVNRIKWRVIVKTLTYKKIRTGNWNPAFDSLQSSFSIWSSVYLSIGKWLIYLHWTQPNTTRHEKIWRKYWTMWKFKNFGSQHKMLIRVNCCYLNLLFRIFRQITVSGTATIEWKREKIDLLRGIARGMCHLHSHNIIH